MNWNASQPVSAARAQTVDEAFRACRDMDEPLDVRLEALTEAIRRLHPAYSDEVDRLVDRLAKGHAGENAPSPGDLMPPFVLPDDKGRLVDLDSLLRPGPVAIAFFRGHWCPYCRISFRALARAQAEIAAEGLRIVAIMPERRDFTSAFKLEAEAALPILTDVDNGYAMSVNLTFWLGDELPQRLRAGSGRRVAEAQGNDAWVFPLPATFVVGTDGRITARFVDPDYRKRMDIDMMVAALRAAR